MMKKFALIGLLLLTGACAKDKSFVNQGSQELPEWVMNPAIQYGYGGVGIAAPSQGGLKFQVAIAEIDAKGAIAAQLGAEISRLTKNALRSAQVNGVDDVEEFFEQATKEIIKDIPLNGIVRDKFAYDKDGTLYLHMTFRSDDYHKFLDASEAKVMAKLQNSRIARENINKGQEATKAIFEELNKEVKRVKD